MNHSLVDQIASAVLYEGYILYPYRPSVKNRQRWTFGGLVPRAYSDAHGPTEPWEMQTECLVLGGPDTTLTVSVRCLQLVARLVGEFAAPLDEWSDSDETPCRIVEALKVGDELLYTWKEALEQKIELGESSLVGLIANPSQREFDLASHREREPLRGTDGKVVGTLARERRRVQGVIELSAQAVGTGTFRLCLKIQNLTPLRDATDFDRDQALLHGLVSTHAVLSVRQGAFVSLIDPPESLREPASACQNVGCWPVLVGDEGETDTMLAAPIILYDYPRIAPESPGDLFDGTEIDEILTLRIMTLTDQEKRAMAAVDARARSVLDRTEAL